MFKLYVYYESIFEDKLCCSEFIIGYEEAAEAIRHYKTGGRIVVTEPLTDLMSV